MAIFAASSHHRQRHRRILRSMDDLPTGAAGHLRRSTGDVCPLPGRRLDLHGQDPCRTDHVAPAGRRERPAGIPRELHRGAWRFHHPHRLRRGAAGHGLAPRPADPLHHPRPDRRAGRLAAVLQGHLPARPRRLLDRQRGFGGKHQRGAHGPGIPSRGAQLRALRGKGAGELRRRRAVVVAGPDHDPDGGYPHRRRHGLHHRRRRPGGAGSESLAIGVLAKLSSSSRCSASSSRCACSPCSTQ